MTVQQRARLGLGRTFQIPRIPGALSVLNNATLGAGSGCAPGLSKRLWGCRAGGKPSGPSVAEELLRGVGLGPAAHQKANRLEHAAQRFLEIARALALRPRFLLLDEPAGGLTETGIA